jgi:hypothetical protein
MASAFERAAEERGRGMKARMIDTIGRHAKDTAKVMFADARKAVLDGVGGLVDALKKNQDEMSEAVKRQSALMVENVTKVTPGLTSGQIAEIEQELKKTAAALASITEAAVPAAAQA